MTDKQSIEHQIKQHHTGKGRRVLEATYEYDGKKQLQSVRLKCFEHNVHFLRETRKDFVERALDWLKKGETVSK